MDTNGNPASGMGSLYNMQGHLDNVPQMIHGLSAGETYRLNLDLGNSHFLKVVNRSDGQCIRLTKFLPMSPTRISIDYDIPLQGWTVLTNEMEKIRNSAGRQDSSCHLGGHQYVKTYSGESPMIHFTVHLDNDQDDVGCGQDVCITLAQFDCIIENLPAIWGNLPRLPNNVGPYEAITSIEVNGSNHFIRRQRNGRAGARTRATARPTIAKKKGTMGSIKHRPNTK